MCVYAFTCCIDFHRCLNVALILASSAASCISVAYMTPLPFHEDGRPFDLMQLSALSRLLFTNEVLTSTSGGSEQHL